MKIVYLHLAFKSLLSTIKSVQSDTMVHGAMHRLQLSDNGGIIKTNHVTKSPPNGNNRFETFSILKLWNQNNESKSISINNYYYEFQLLLNQMFNEQ